MERNEKRMTEAELTICRALALETGWTELRYNALYDTFFGKSHPAHIGADRPIPNPFEDCNATVALMEWGIQQGFVLKCYVFGGGVSCEIGQRIQVERCATAQDAITRAIYAAVVLRRNAA